MRRQDAVRRPRPEGREGLRSAAVGGVGAGAVVLVVQLALGRTSGLVLGALVGLSAALSFGVRYLANPRR